MKQDRDDPKKASRQGDHCVFGRKRPCELSTWLSGADELLELATFQGIPIYRISEPATSNLHLIQKASPYEERIRKTSVNSCQLPPLIRTILALCFGLWSPLSGQIHPVIIDNCTKCHGGVKQKGGLDLRTVESAIEGGETETSLIPGDVEKSPLSQVIQVDSDPHMPPKKQLAPAEIKSIENWITHLKITPPVELILPDPAEDPTSVIDSLVSEKWQEEKITPAQLSNDATFVRRIHLDLLGRIPKTEEAQSFLKDPNPHKRNALIDRLTETKQHAEHLTQTFNVIFLDRAETRKRNRGERKAWLNYLRWTFETNRPWDQVGRDLLIARPTQEIENGASWFLYDQRDDHKEMATRTSRTLLGKQVQCAQCHDHPVAPEIEQRHYWGLVAFFNRSLNVKTPEGPRVAERAHGGYDQFANLEGKTDQSQLILYSNKIISEPDGKRIKDSPGFYRVAPPEQWFKKLKKNEKLKKDLPALPVPKFSRREEFAKAITSDNPDFSSAIVNRIWALLFGRGLVHPVDLMDSSHPTSHPELLAWLTRDFANNGHNLRRLIRVLAKSQAYQLDSRPAPSASNPPLDSFFARSLDKPLSAEALARSVRITLGYDAPNDMDFRNRFAKIFPALFAENFSPSVQQTMSLTNGKFFNQLIADSPLLDKLKEIEDPQTLVRETFQNILSREPDNLEKERSLSFVKAKDHTSIEQFCWALITGAEFRLNH
tara:strand:+ start:4721 stop:6868 length:2148 start_codon:yes stop_codon:yes gene_type:complete